MTSTTLMHDVTAYDEFWSRFFGLGIEQFLSSGVHVVPHAALGEYAGIWFFKRGASTVVSAPPDWIDRLPPPHVDRIEEEPLPKTGLLEDILHLAHAMR